MFFDIAQFYHNSLVNAYLQNIGTLPGDYLLMKKQRAEFSPRYYSRNKTKIRNYCIADCKYTKELSIHWINLFLNAFEFYPARWISSGYLAEKVLINHGIDMPKFDQTSYKIQDLAYKSYFGGRFEILKRGFIGKAYLYDINSAYPYALTKIPDITKGEWIQTDKILNDAKLGFFKIKVDIPDCTHIPLFPFRTNHTMIFPSGKFITYCTLAELQACNDDSLYRILEGYQFIAHSNIYPYRKFIEKLYKKRLKLKQENNPLQLPIKIILNSIYGKTGQKVRGKIGNLFNPVIFASITGIARAQLYDFVIKNGIEKEVVSFATDSICYTKKLGVNSIKLGEFSLDNEADDVFILQNGIYRFNGKWKQRGLGKLGTRDIEHFDTYEKDGKLFCKFKLLRNSRLRSSILQNQISEIGKIKEIQREVNLNADRKRLWLGQINSITDKIMNESVALSLNFFQKEQI
ncbi:MAG: DNA polymerase [Thaumarchaeota archaeon]|nr:DNA polymerase [Nitrososphaerota archaeon]